VGKFEKFNKITSYEVLIMFFKNFFGGYKKFSGVCACGLWSIGRFYDRSRYRAFNQVSEVTVSTTPLHLWLSTDAQPNSTSKPK